MLTCRPSRRAIVLAVVACATAAQAQTTDQRRSLVATDIYRLRSVRDPQVSPEGGWVAYTVTSVDSAKDRSETDIWMTSWDGTQTLRVTSTPGNETAPRWSPDGRYLAFLSSRQAGDGAQVWLLDRRGGEAQRVTTIRDGVADLAWSPDASRLVLVATVKTDSAAADTTRPHPILVDRYQFKQDRVGYLTRSHSHLFLFDVASRTVDTLTTGDADDESPAWSPDGTRLAFVRSPEPGPGAGEGSDVFVVEARAGSQPVRLTDFVGPDGGALAWSPDGRWVAFTRGDEPRFSAYQLRKLAVAPSDASAPARVLTAALDRPVSRPTFLSDGSALRVIVADDRRSYLARVRVADGATEPIASARRSVQGYSVAARDDGKVALLVATPDRAPEVYALERDTLRPLSHQNDSLFAVLQLGAVEDLVSRSPDGTEVHSLVVRPAGSPRTSPVPLVVHVHGGPNGQDDYGFSFDWQWLAANGYAVLAVNYRGSAGRGERFQKAIFADWGHFEVVDVLGAVDEAVRQRIADPDRLGIGGWSYGGITTDYVIATTTRFRGAVAGAGGINMLGMYGTDQYIQQYDLELGPPWVNSALYLRLAYPFLHADRIRTPTLFMGGALDANVPITGGEQMYQALRRLGVPTQLVVYPGEYHGITRPSFIRDRLERRVAWFDRYVKPAPPAASPAR
jgi:dipeptidyl aminopeptidase/acylaminoacyl peptidase